MGHSLAEMFPNGRDTTFYQRYTRYQQACAKEISDIIRKNPIRNEDIQVGDRVSLYAPLLGMSRIRFDNEGEFNRIRDLFSSTAHYYSMNLWALAFADVFKVWDKMTVRDNVRKEETHLIRIDEPAKPFGSMPFALDFNPH